MLIAPVGLAQPQTPTFVSFDNLAQYAITLTSTYQKTITDYFPDLKSNFYFYSESYLIGACISSNYGAGIIFEPYNTNEIQNFSSSLPIEVAVFGGRPDNLYGAFGLQGYTVINDNVVGNINVVSRLELDTVIILKNTTVTQNEETIHFTYVILKGNNATISWTANSAKTDANEILYNDMHIEFVSDPKIKERYASPELEAKLLEIENSFPQNGTSEYYPWSRWQADIAYLENLAINKYHLPAPTGFLNELITYMNLQTGRNLPTIPPSETPTPTPTIIPTSTTSSTPIATTIPNPNTTIVPTNKSTPTTENRAELSVNLWQFVVVFIAAVFATFAIYTVLYGLQRLDSTTDSNDKVLKDMIKDTKSSGTELLSLGALWALFYAVFHLETPFEIGLTIIILLVGWFTGLYAIAARKRIKKKFVSMWH